MEGKRKVTRNVEYYNLDVIISVGYRIKSQVGTRFRQWANSVLKPEQKHILYLVHEYGIGPRTLSRLTGVPYAIVQRATSKAHDQRNNTNMVCEDTPEDELFFTYCDEGHFQQYPEY